MSYEFGAGFQHSGYSYMCHCECRLIGLANCCRGFVQGLNLTALHSPFTFALFSLPLSVPLSSLSLSPSLFSISLHLSLCRFHVLSQNVHKVKLSAHSPSTVSSVVMEATPAAVVAVHVNVPLSTRQVGRIVNVLVVTGRPPAVTVCSVSSDIRPVTMDDPVGVFQTIVG